MGLKDTLNDLEKVKQEKERFEQEKPARIQKIKEKTSSVLDDISRFLSEYIENGQMSIERSRHSYDYYSLADNIESEKLTIEAGGKTITAKPVGGNMLGEQIIEVRELGREKKYSIYTKVDVDEVTISAQDQSKKSPGQPERRSFDKENFENALDDLLK